MDAFVCGLGRSLDPMCNTYVKRLKDNRCCLANKDTGKSQCKHTFDYEKLKQWLTQEKKTSDRICPRCTKLGTRVKSGVILENVKTESDVRNVELDDTAILIAWEGENQSDVHYELFKFKHPHTSEGFFDAINETVNVSADPGRSMFYKKGYDTAVLEKRLWNKFPRIVSSPA